MLEEGEQVVEIPLHIQQPAGLFVKTQLSPGQCFENLLKSAPASWHGNKAVRHMRHQRFSLVHRMHDMLLRQAGMRHLFNGQRLGNDANRLAARVQHGIGDSPHHANPRAAVDQANAARSQPAAQFSRSVQVSGVATRAGTAVNADSFHARPPRADG